MADADVRDFLIAWGLEQYTDEFERHSIDIRALAVLTEEHLKQLVPSIGHRAKLAASIKEWKEILKTVNAADKPDVKIPVEESREEANVDESREEANVDESREEANVDESSSTPIGPISGSSSLYTLLSSNNEGKGLLLNFKKSGILDNSSRNKRCDLIIKEELKLDPSKSITSARLLELSQEIISIFPRELKSTYFIPYITYGKLKKSAKGKLLNSVQKYRKKYKKVGLISSSSSTSTCNTSNKQYIRVDELLKSSGEDISDEIKQHLIWLQSSSEPLETVQVYWIETATERLRQLLTSNKTIAEYMKEYPALKKPFGYTLLTNDFEYLYQHNTNKLFEQFPLYKSKIIDLGKKKSLKDQALHAIVHNIENDSTEVNQEEVETYGALCILPYLLQPHTVHYTDKSEKDKTRKTVWRPSRSETKDGFITEVAGTLDLQKCISDRKEKLQALGLPLQPLVVSVKQDSGNDYYVVIDNTYFQFKTILEAVDCCFKCIHALNAKYPHEAAALWTFIQKGFYKLKTPWDQRFVSVSTLFSDLDISPDLE